jgi:hypothetical protein
MILRKSPYLRVQVVKERPPAIWHYQELGSSLQNKVSMKIKNIGTVLVVAFILSSCSQPLIVRLDTLGYFKPEGEGLSTGWAFKGDFPNNFECYSESDCMLIHFNSKSQTLGWSLMIWYPFSCEHGTPDQANCITDRLKSGNFNEIQRLTFWARGKEGNEIVEFGVGGGFETVIGPYGFEYFKPQEQPAGRITLTSHWEKYEIDLVDRDLTHVVPLFYAFYTVEENPQGAIIYVDDIQFEGY